ncbi:hypothetical protein CBR_g34325 [Chara braunii]|uniref:Uncharacterized protein n=1 Tax=Chara braunii TaxID=69332 RepID=A0A388LI97_CHABU|nr:hypothetical protein CBR_g34325 [Chara braunii]|eukprot:GBG82046.1 hypothetical protein CBR_g34325 [Chara braunii]
MNPFDPCWKQTVHKWNTAAGSNSAKHQATQLRQHNCTMPKTTARMTGQAHMQHDNGAVKRIAARTRQPNFTAHKQRKQQARHANGQQGSRVAKHKAAPTTQPHQIVNTAACKERQQSKRDRQQGSGGAQTRQSTHQTRSKAAHHLLTSRLSPAGCWFPPPAEPGSHSDDHLSSPAGNTDIMN